MQGKRDVHPGIRIIIDTYIMQYEKMVIYSNEKSRDRKHLIKEKRNQMKTFKTERNIM